MYFNQIFILNITTFMNFVFIFSTFILNIVLASKRRRFYRATLDSVEVWSRIGGYTNKIHENYYI